MNYWYIKSLRLKDFGIFENIYLDFSKNINNLLGGNASGKSTILQAIKLSLQLNDKKVPVNNFIRKAKVNPPKKAITELTLIVDNKPVVIYSEYAGGNARKIYRKIILENGEILENNLANNFLTETLGLVNLKLMFAINPKQNFISNQPSTNFKTFIDILSISFEKEIDYSKSHIKILNNNELDLNKNYQQTDSNIKLLEDNLNQLVNSVEDLNEQLKNLPKTPDDESFIQKEINDLFYKKEALKNKLDLVESNNTAFYKNQEELKSTQLTLANYESEFCELSKIDVLKKSTEDIEDIVANLSDQITDLKKGLLDNNKEYEKLTYHTQNLLSKIKMIENGVCPVCNQNTDNVKCDYSNQLKELDNTQKILKDKINNFNSEISNLVNIRDNNQLKIKNINQDNIDKDKIKTKISYLENIINLTKANIAKLEQSDLEYLDKQTLQKDYQDLTQKYDKLNNELNNYKDLQKQTIQLETWLKSKKTDIEKTAKDIESLKSSRSTIISDMGSIKNLKNNEAKILSLFESLSGTYLKYIISNVEKLGSSLVNIFGYSGLKLEIDNTEKTLEFYLMKMDYDIPYKLLSGFETDLLNLVVIISLSKLLRLPCLCFDELDAHIDPGKVELIADLIKRLSDTSQILVITHNPNMSANWLTNDKNYKIYKLSGGEIVYD